MKIVFIHGRSQGGKDPIALQQTWENSFDEGLRNAGLCRPGGLEIAFPYYGDILDGLIDELDAPLVADVVERGASQDDDEGTFRGEFLAEIAKGAGFTDDDIRANLDGEFVERGPLNWKWVRAIMKTLDNSNKIGDAVLDAFTRDVYVYLTNRKVRLQINALIEPHINGGPCVVVGHSLGSIIGYLVLQSLRANVTRYITVGSPLGVKAVQRRLKEQIGMPENTQSWYNARDRQDFVALYPLDTEHFDITPSIKNHNSVDNNTDNRHGIIGYLPDRWVAEAIQGGLTS